MSHKQVKIFTTTSLQSLTIDPNNNQGTITLHLREEYPECEKAFAFSATLDDVKLIIKELSSCVKEVESNLKSKQQ